MRARPSITASSAGKKPCLPAADGTRNAAPNRRIAGVCGLFGDYTPIPAWTWRLMFLALLLCGGIGLIAYLALWMCLPAPANQAASIRSGERCEAALAGTNHETHNANQRVIEAAAETA